MMLITFGIHLYEICTKNVFLICLVYFQNCAAIKKTRGSQEPVIAHLVFNLTSKVDRKWGCYT